VLFELDGGHHGQGGVAPAAVVPFFDRAANGESCFDFGGPAVTVVELRFEG